MAGKKRKLLFSLALAVAAIIVAGIYLYNINTQENAGAVKVYFVKDGGIYGLKRTLPEGTDQLYFSSIQLLKGPSAEEKAKGYYTLVPEYTRLLRIFKKDNIAVIDLTKELGMYGGGTAKVQGMLAQIVYTLTETKGIDEVRILVAGKKVTALGSEGYDIEKPLSRDDVKK